MHKVALPLLQEAWFSNAAGLTLLERRSLPVVDDCCLGWWRRRSSALCQLITYKKSTDVQRHHCTMVFAILFALCCHNARLPSRKPRLTCQSVSCPHSTCTAVLRIAVLTTDSAGLNTDFFTDLSRHCWPETKATAWLVCRMSLAHTHHAR